MRDKKFRVFLGFVIAIWVLIFFIFKGEKLKKTDRYETQIKAYELMEEASQKIIEYKKSENIEISKEDILKTGLIGEEYSEITTTLGNLSAKRTAATPDMAAMLVKMYEELSLKENDKIAIATSGSFPGLNLAAICAAESMHLKTVVISSIGASTYGANQKDMTFPKMLDLLNKDGILYSNSSLITPGGDDDIGSNMDIEVLQEILSDFEKENLDIMINPDFKENILARTKIFDEEKKPDAFVAVGGNLSFLGLNDNSIKNQQGILKKPKNLPAFSDDKGLVNYYLNKNTPVIYLLNIKKIVSDYNLQFDPEKLPKKGTSAVFFEEYYPKELVYFSAFLVLLCFIYLVRK